MCLKKTSRNRRFWLGFWRQTKIAGLKGVTCALATSCGTSSPGLRLTPPALGGEEKNIASGEGIFASVAEWRPPESLMECE